MAMVKCKNCGEEISKAAKVCPKCGDPRKRGCLKFVLIGLGVLVAVIVLAVVAHSASTSQVRLLNAYGQSGEQGFLVFENASDKSVEAFKGDFLVYDAFGKVQTTIKVECTTPIKPKEKFYCMFKDSEFVPDETGMAGNMVRGLLEGEAKGTPLMTAKHEFKCREVIQK